MLPEPPKCMFEVVRLDKASYGWEPETPLFTGVNMIVERGMRLVVIGPNGAGKSTLLWALAGMYECVCVYVCMYICAYMYMRLVIIGT